MIGMDDVYRLRDVVLDHPGISWDELLEKMGVDHDTLAELVSELVKCMDRGTLAPRPRPKSKLTLSDLLEYG